MLNPLQRAQGNTPEFGCVTGWGIILPGSPLMEILEDPVYLPPLITSLLNPAAHPSHSTPQNKGLCLASISSVQLLAASFQPLWPSARKEKGRCGDHVSPVLGHLVSHKCSCIAGQVIEDAGNLGASSQLPIFHGGCKGHMRPSGAESAAHCIAYGYGTQKSHSPGSQPHLQNNFTHKQEKRSFR